jgi:hypothetical protein
MGGGHQSTSWPLLNIVQSEKFAEMKDVIINLIITLIFLQVPGPRVGGDRIPTRRGGVRPSFVLPHNQPASYEGAAAAADVSSSPAPTLSSGGVQSDLIQALEAESSE